MDRKTYYRGLGPVFETDLGLAERFAYEGLGLLVLDLLGAGPLVTGLACTPSTPAALTVKIAPGRLYTLQNLEPTAWGRLLTTDGFAADTNPDHNITKQAILRDTTILSGFAAPGTVGQSINYLVQAAFQEVDTTVAPRQFWNVSAPSSPIITNVSDQRQDQLILGVKAGAPAATGSQVTPTADAGFVPIWVVTVANGQTTVTAPNIIQHPSAPVLTALALQPLSLGGLLAPPQITANQNDYAPTGISAASRIDLFTDASRTITGMAAAPADGAMRLIRNVGSFPIVLSDADAGSVAANRFSFGVSRTIQPNRAILLVYNSTAQRWRDVNALSKASASDVWTGTDDERFITPAANVASGVAQVLADAATIAWNLAAGQRAKVTLGGNRTLGQPTGLYEGASGSLQVIQDGTGSRTLAYAACWDFRFPGSPTLSTAAGKRDVIFYEVVDAVTPVIIATFSKSA